MTALEALERAVRLSRDMDDPAQIAAHIAQQLKLDGIVLAYDDSTEPRPKCRCTPCVLPRDDVAGRRYCYRCGSPGTVDRPDGGCDNCTRAGQ